MQLCRTVRHCTQCGASRIKVQPRLRNPSKTGLKKGHASLSGAARGTCSPLTFIELDALQEFNVAYMFFFFSLLFACLSFYVEFCTAATTTTTTARINKWEVLLWKVLPESWGRIWRPSPSARCAADLSALLWRTLSCPRWKGNWNAFHLQMRAPTAERAASGGSSHEPASSSTETTMSVPVHYWNSNAHARLHIDIIVTKWERGHSGIHSTNRFHLMLMSNCLLQGILKLLIDGVMMV